jgi:hypothetical protein
MDINQLFVWIVKIHFFSAMCVSLYQALLTSDQRSSTPMIVGLHWRARSFVGAETARRSPH